MDIRTSVRLQCLDLAVRTVGNPNITQRAQEYFEFAMLDEPQAEAQKTIQKGKTK